MKKLILFATFLLATSFSLSSISCDSDDSRSGGGGGNDGISHPIVGKWLLSEQKSSSGSSWLNFESYGSTLEFRSNGTATSYSFPQKADYKYEVVSDKKIRMFDIVTTSSAEAYDLNIISISSSSLHCTYVNNYKDGTSKAYEQKYKKVN